MLGFECTQQIVGKCWALLARCLLCVEHRVPAFRGLSMHPGESRVLQGPTLHPNRLSVLEALLLPWLSSAGLIVLCKHLGSLEKPFTPRSHQRFRHTRTELLTVKEWVCYIVKTTIRMGSKCRMQRNQKLLFLCGFPFISLPKSLVIYMYIVPMQTYNAGCPDSV